MVKYVFKWCHFILLVLITNIIVGVFVKDWVTEVNHGDWDTVTADLLF